MKNRKRGRAFEEEAAARWTGPLRTEEHDGLTFPLPAFQGTSDIGVMPGPDTEPFTADNVREIGNRTWDQPDVLGLHQAPMAADTDPAPIGDTTARGWAHLFTVTCIDNAAPSALPIPCGQSHSDGTAGTYDALYRSAWDAGWRPDTHYRWHCPHHAQLSSLYQALWPVTLYALTDEELLERTRRHYDASHRRGTHARQATA